MGVSTSGKAKLITAVGGGQWAESRRQKAEGKRQKAVGRKIRTVRKSSSQAAGREHAAQRRSMTNEK